MITKPEYQLSALCKSLSLVKFHSTLQRPLSRSSIYPYPASYIFGQNSVLDNNSEAPFSHSSSVCPCRLWHSGTGD